MLRDRRIEAGLTMEDLAYSLDIGLDTLHRYENDNHVGPGDKKCTAIVLRLMRWSRIKAEDFTEY